MRTFLTTIVCLYTLLPVAFAGEPDELASVWPASLRALPLNAVEAQLIGEFVAPLLPKAKAFGKAYSPAEVAMEILGGAHVVIRDQGARYLPFLAQAQANLKEGRDASFYYFRESSHYDNPDKEGGWSHGAPQVGIRLPSLGAFLIGMQKRRLPGLDRSEVVTWFQFEGAAQARALRAHPQGFATALQASDLPEGIFPGNLRPEVYANEPAARSLSFYEKYVMHDIRDWLIRYTLLYQKRKNIGPLGTSVHPDSDPLMVDARAR